MRHTVRIAGLASLLLAASALAEPRPISAPERSAVEFSLAYLAGNEAAWLARLVPDSELARMPAGERLSRLRAALGPVEGSVWRLATMLPEASGGQESAAFRIEYPSGLVSFVTLAMMPGRKAGEWRVADVTTWVELISRPGVDGSGRTVAVAGDASGSSARRLASMAQGLGRPLPWFVVASVLIFGGLVLHRWSWGRWPSRGLLGLGFLAIGATVLVQWGAGGAGLERASVASAAEAELWSRYAVARSALASTGDLAGLDALRAAVPAGGGWAERVDVSRAEGLMLQADHAGARALLTALALTPEHRGVVDWLLARLAAQEKRDTEVVLAWDRAATVLPSVDLLLGDAARMLDDLGFESRALALHRQVLEGGTREAAYYYVESRRLLFQNAERNRDPALELFRTAWSLEPSPRVSLVGDPAALFVARDARMKESVRLGEIVEPPVSPTDLAREPLALPAGFQATVSGRQLWIESATTRLELPNGAAVAPRSTTVEDAVTRIRREEDRALAEPGRSSRHLEAATSALARRDDWASIVELTQPYASRPLALGVVGTQLRGEALSRLRGPDSAVEWLAEAARQRKGRVDAGLYGQLAELLRRQGRLDLAIRAMEKAEAGNPFVLLSDVPRLRMDQEVERTFVVRESKHFRLRVPPGLASPFQVLLMNVIEREWVRLRRWVPAADTHKIEVDLLPFRDFMRLYSRGMAIGLFDGKVRLPFGDVPTLENEAIGIYGHEILHAMLAERSQGRAPHWFQEGLAQSAQAFRAQLNPIADYEGKGHLLAFSLVESVLSRPADPELVMQAYEESTWAVEFIEARRGVAGLHQMTDSFASGAGTEEALRRVMGMTIEDFDRALRAWSRTEAGSTRSANPVRYEDEVIRAYFRGEM